MKAWLVSDDPYAECSLSIIAETRSRAKAIALSRFYSAEWIDLRCRQVKSPIPIDGPERIIFDITESLWYGFRWNDDTMAEAFPGWYGCWLYEERGS